MYFSCHANGLIVGCNTQMAEIVDVMFCSCDYFKLSELVLDKLENTSKIFGIHTIFHELLMKFSEDFL